MTIYMKNIHLLHICFSQHLSMTAATMKEAAKEMEEAKHRENKRTGEKLVPNEGFPKVQQQQTNRRGQERFDGSWGCWPLGMRGPKREWDHGMTWRKNKNV